MTKTILVPVEPTPEMVRTGAHKLTGGIGANCCYKTGGKRTDGEYCECQDIAKEVFAAMLSAAPIHPSEDGGK